MSSLYNFLYILFLYTMVWYAYWKWIILYYLISLSIAYKMYKFLSFIDLYLLYVNVWYYLSAFILYVSTNIENYDFDLKISLLNSIGYESNNSFSHNSTPSLLTWSHFYSAVFTSSSASYVIAYSISSNWVSNFVLYLHLLLTL